MYDKAPRRNINDLNYPNPREDIRRLYWTQWLYIYLFF